MCAELSQRQIIAEAKHQQALELLEKQQLAGALRLLGESLAQEETCERWNDWAVAQFTAGRRVEAEQGFRYAIAFDVENREVSGNLGVLLVECDRESEAIPFLERALGTGNDGYGKGTAEVLLTVCRDTVATWLDEFRIRLRQAPAPLEQIPRWPLTQYALRLAQLGELEAALEMVSYNRHFQPADLELAKMQACLAMLLERPAAGSQTSQVKESAPAAPAEGSGARGV